MSRAGELPTADSGPGEIVALRAEVQALRARLDALDRPNASAREGEAFAAMYPAFQDRFRGSEADVRSRLAVYLPDVVRVATGLGVLDLGAGRGEWLALLAEQGVPTYGVEENGEQAARLRRDQGLRLVDSDAVSHLRQVPPASLDMITAFHVIEHLDTDVLLHLLDAARAALRPGGCLILETPNPTNLVMAACNFYLDPTHRQPMPSALTAFLVTARGFADVQISEQATDLVGLALTKAFFGPQDYAVVATRPPDPGPRS